VPASSETRRRDRAIADIRHAHRTAHDLVEALAGPHWGASRGGGWSPAETLLHLALTTESVLRGLRVVAAHGAVARPRARSLAQRALWMTARTTWSLPRGAGAVEGSDPRGLILDPESCRERHTRGAADFVAFLQDRDHRLLGNVRYVHPAFGELDTFEWARFHRIHARHHELRLLSG
jgi:hypothetical protein